MDQAEKVRRLKSMLAQTAPGGTVESVRQQRPRPASAQALEGFAEPRGADAETHIDGGLGKLAENREQDLTPQETHALEAIVMPENRPVAFVRGGAYDDLGGIWAHLNAEQVRARITPVLRSVGRIELPQVPWVPYGGTGFIVGRNLLMTNRHVARLFADGLGVGAGLRYVAGDTAIDFHREVDSREDDRTAYFTVVRVEMIHPYWDMALLRCEGLSDRFGPLKLSVRSPEELVDRDIVAVGYPARDDRSDLALQDQIFGRVYNVKRLQPGKLRPRERIQSFENVVDAATHDSSTLGGNSGSAVIDVETGEVVGLHFAGVYLKANYAVPTFELARDRRIVDAGVNFNGSVAATRDWDPVWQRVSGSEASPVPVATPADGAAAPPVSAQNTATFTLPLTLTLSIGQPMLVASSSGAALAATEAARTRVPVIFGGLERRQGYQAGFLELEDGAEVPLPELTAVGLTVIAPLQGGAAELKYHKFSVVVHRGRRMALFTASNVDWRPELRKIDGKTPTRLELTGLASGTPEQWVTDWRISPQHQLPDVFFTKDGGAFDKGHLVRRDDVCWGKTFEDIQKSNGDTFHTTNCSPQVAGFNQSAKGEDNWGDLENLVQSETKAEKAIIFSGPVLADDDKHFTGRDEAGMVIVQIPSRFWKVIIVKGAAGPEAYGFVLEQDLAQVPLEFAVPVRWRTYMRRIEEIEGLLNDLAHLPWLKKFDRADSVESVRIAQHLG